MKITDEILIKARDLQLATKNNKGTFRRSGELLEDRHQLLYNHKRFPKASPFDFEHKDWVLDIKGCWAEKYERKLFIEALQNPNTGTTPAYIKEENKSRNIFLVFVDYDTGDEYWVLWNKLYERIKDWHQVAGGDCAMGWIVS